MPGPATVDLRSAPGAVAIERDVLLVHGPDAVSFLQGQLSQDVEALEVGTSRPTFLLQPTGKVDAWMRVTRTADDALLLDVDAGWGDAVHARLKRFKLRTKAELEPGCWSGLALRGPGSRAAAASPSEGIVCLEAGWSGIEGVDLLGPPGTAVHTDLPLVPEAALLALRIEAGVPAMGADVDDTTIPGELGKWAIDESVSFTKGCYTGQELVARIDSRGGNVPHPLRGLVLDALVAVGATVSVDGAEVGHVTSVATSPDLGPIALAVLGRSVPFDAVVSVDGGGSPVAGRVRELPLR
jgi:folate-binding protein YgfZ